MQCDSALLSAPRRSKIYPRPHRPASGSGDAPNVDALRMLPALPDTADELQAIAKTLGANSASIYLQWDAAATNARRPPLERYRVLAFATHSLVAGEAKDIEEPGLVLTPPAKGTPEDDGFLGASEVGQLNLNADWVVLSACNTAAPDGTPGAAGLTGLAKSFFYAGARALLVSHWPVISSATPANHGHIQTACRQTRARKIGRATPGHAEHDR